MNASDFHLTSAEIHVWAIWLTAPDEVSNAYRALLGLEEIVRADKFAFENLKRRYEIAHGALRLLLARYLECPPCAVSFKIGPRSKPALKGDSALQFNLSHSVDLAVFAFAVGCELGVDVEQVREIKEMENIASRYFCEAEASDLSSIARSEVKKEAFFRCWTRKEAYIKAVGSGLYLPLDQFQVTLLPDDPPAFIHIGKSTKTAAEWTLHHLELAARYVGAIAHHAPGRSIVFHEPYTPKKFLDEIG